MLVTVKYHGAESKHNLLFYRPDGVWLFVQIVSTDFQGSTTLSKPKHYRLREGFLFTMIIISFDVLVTCDDVNRFAWKMQMIMR